MNHNSPSSSTPELRVQIDLKQMGDIFHGSLLTTFKPKHLQEAFVKLLS